MQPRKPPPLSPLLPLLPIAYRRCPLPSSSANRSLDRPFFLSFLPHTIVALFLPPLPDAAFIAPSVLLTLPACRSSTVVSAPSNATQLPLPSLMSHLPPSLLRCFLFLAGPRCSSPQPLQRHQPSQTPQHSNDSKGVSRVVILIVQPTILATTTAEGIARDCKTLLVAEEATMAGLSSRLRKRMTVEAEAGIAGA
ncbi:hypothetical protein BHM03_00009427 [Ensete ventricosum]|nr:hypothetical protein BHM03_00009427 [Ensete ventricosum]